MPKNMTIYNALNHWSKTLDRQLTTNRNRPIIHAEIQKEYDETQDLINEYRKMKDVVTQK